MKLKSLPIKNIIIDIICLLYIVLFVYAATSKILDFENFKVQLGQSPLLTAFADYVAIGVPAIEYVITLMLIIPKFRFYGLLAAFSLMLMFSTYIVIILNSGQFIPCSCGGILEKMGWTEHLIFNIGFVLLALIALILHRKFLIENLETNSYQYHPNKNINLLGKKRFIISTSITFITSIIIVFLLYFFSEQEIHRNNGFTRRMPHHPANAIKAVDIKFNSYYIAGFEKGRIYLGNVTAPLRVLSIDKTLNDVKEITLKINDVKKYHFSSIQVRVEGPYFYMSDGRVPVVLRGKIGEWVAKPFSKNDKNFFTHLEPMDTINFALRGINVAEGNIIGKLSISKKNDTIKLVKGLLRKRGDGLFDTDGMLSYNKELEKLVYVYYYRNEYVTINRDFSGIYRGNTIDTLKEVKLKIADVKSRGERKFANNPTKIQEYSTTYGKYLFVKSDRLGKYEREIMLKDAGIIDVYDLQKHTYEFSFYLYNYENEKIKSFKVHGNLLFGLTDKKYLVCYKLADKYFDFKTPEKATKSNK